jgi:HEAT repeat protein
MALKRRSGFVLGLVLGTLMVCTWGCAELPVEEESEPPVQAEPAMSKQELTRYSRAERLLDSSRSEVRQNAAMQLIGMDNERALEAVCRRIRSGDPEVRVDMIKAASLAVEHRCFDEILGAVQAPNGRVREAAASALSRFSRPQEVARIMQFMSAEDTSAQARELLITAVGEGLFLEVTPVLLKALQSEQDPVRQAALKSLRQVSGRDFGPDLARWQQWWQTNKHREREEILEERLWVLRDELETVREEKRRLAAQLEDFSNLVRSAGPATPKPLLQGLLNPHERVRSYAAFRLASLSKQEKEVISLDDRETYEILREALQQGKPTVRQDVVELVASLQGQYRSALLLDALEDDNPGVLTTAIEALNGQVSDAAVQRLERALDSPHAPVREAAANALGRTGARGATSALIDALDDAEENVRWFAVESLRKLKAEEATPQLCVLLQNDPSPRVREICATALGELGQPAAVPCLRKALRDENERVRQRAVSSLKSLAGDGFERVMIIAEALDERGFEDDAADVLREAIDRYADDEQYAQQVRAARRALARVLKGQDKFLEAAAIYATMEGQDGGDPEIRQQLVDCWIRGGEPQRVVGAVEEWVDVESEDALRRALQEGIQVVQRLHKDDASLAKEAARIIRPAAEKLGDAEILKKLQDLPGAQDEAEGSPGEDTQGAEGGG